MDIEQIRAYCLSKPHATEDFPFDETTLVFRVMNKIFASIGLDNVYWFAKCDPEYAIESCVSITRGLRGHGIGTRSIGIRLPLRMAMCPMP